MPRPPQVIPIGGHRLYLLGVEVQTIAHFVFGLLDTGAQGSNFISRKLYNNLPPATTALSKSVDRVVRLGDSCSLFVLHEIPLTVSFQDTHGYSHAHNVWYSVFDVLPHDIIIGLIHLIGPYYDLFEDFITSSRQIATANQLGGHLATVTSQVQSTSETTHTPVWFKAAVQGDYECSRAEERGRKISDSMHAIDCG